MILFEVLVNTDMPVYGRYVLHVLVKSNTGHSSIKNYTGINICACLFSLIQHIKIHGSGSHIDTETFRICSKKSLNRIVQQNVDLFSLTV